MAATRSGEGDSNSPKGVPGTGYRGTQLAMSAPKLGDPPRNLDHVIVVHPGDDDRVDLDDHVVLLEHADRLGLAGPEQLGRGQPAIDLLAVADPGVDLGADLRIDGVDGQRDVAHCQLAEGLGMRRQAQPVGGHAEQHFRMGLADQAERLQRQRRRGERDRPGRQCRRPISAYLWPAPAASNPTIAAARGWPWSRPAGSRWRNRRSVCRSCTARCNPAAMGKCTRPWRWRASMLKQGCVEISGSMRSSPSHVRVTHGRAFLGRFDHGVGDAIEELLCAAIADVQQARPVDPVVDGKTDANQRHVELPRHGEALAVAHDQIGLNRRRVFFHLGEIRALDDRHFLIARRIELFDPLAKPARSGPRSAEDRIDADLHEERGHGNDEILFAVNHGPLAEDVLVGVDIGIDQPSAFLACSAGAGRPVIVVKASKKLPSG